MRTATLTAVLFVALGYAATAQKLTLLPQLGFENSHTAIRYNNLSTINPMCWQASPQLGLRLDYSFKQGHGPFVGVSTSRSIVNFSFTDAEKGMTDYSSNRGDMRLRFEGGYQFSSKPIYFKQPKARTQSSKVNQPLTTQGERRCGSYSYRCGKSMNKEAVSRSRKSGWSMRIQPSVGMAFLPSINPDVVLPQSNQTNFAYKAGNWTSAFIAGAGFEFGKNRQRLFTISINYLKGIGNLSTRTITSTAGVKTVVTNLSSSVSSWSMTAGIPITLYNKKKIKTTTFKQPVERTQTSEKRCGEYKWRCRKAS